MQSNDGEVGLAIVGAGLVAQLHSRAIQTCHQARLVGVYDVQPERAQQLAAAHKARVYQSQDELLKDGDVCGVHVLTPPTGHVPATIAALEAGKHVLLENRWRTKPKTFTKSPRRLPNRIVYACRPTITSMSHHCNKPNV